MILSIYLPFKIYSDERNKPFFIHSHYYCGARRKISGVRMDYVYIPESLSHIVGRAF
jgi:hypothetical protein